MQINSILINLPKRTDRLEHSEKELTKFFGSFPCIISHGVDIENTTIAVREAHKNCIRIAEKINEENILIIEDDILIRSGSIYYFYNLIDNLPKDYEVCLFGVYGGKIIETESEHWNEIKKFSGLHFYVVNKSAYQKIINYNGTQPIDHWIGENLKCYISKKHIAYQLDGYSDNAKTLTNYNTNNLLQYKKYFF